MMEKVKQSATINDLLIENVGGAIKWNKLTFEQRTLLNDVASTYSTRALSDRLGSSRDEVSYWIRQRADDEYNERARTLGVSNLLQSAQNAGTTFGETSQIGGLPDDDDGLA